MKIRIQGNSIRVRTSRGEAARLADGHAIEQQTMFSGEAKLVCSVTPVENAPAASVKFDGTTIAIELPLDEVTRWASSEKVGIERDLRIDAENSLRLLVEKDFECLHSETDAAEDSFPHPARETDDEGRGRSSLALPVARR
jgi:hypothetical protein